MTPTALWLSIGALCLIAMLFVLIPVLRYRAGAGDASLERRRRKNREVYQQRLQELDTEHQQGQLMSEDVERVRSELQRAFMRDMEALAEDDDGLGRSRLQRLLPVAFMCVLPLLAVLLYRSWGAPHDLGLPALMSSIAAAEDQESRTVLLGELAETLQARFDRESDDLQNAYMLGTLYEQLGRSDDALATFTRMLAGMEPGPDMATVLGQMARTQYQLSEGELNAEVQALIDRSLALNPNEYYAMSILANDAFMSEDLEAALGYWRRQLSSAPPGSQQAAQLRQVITLVETYLPEQAPSAGGDQLATAGGSITVTVDIDPALRAQLGDKQSLFVYVRNPDLRPPLLAQNLPIGEFPLTLTLDNSMSMTGMTLESAATLIVGARLSASGSAIAQSGDLQTATEPFVLDELDGPLHLLIDEVVP